MDLLGYSYRDLRGGQVRIALVALGLELVAGLLGCL